MPFRSSAADPPAPHPTSPIATAPASATTFTRRSIRRSYPNFGYPLAGCVLVRLPTTIYTDDHERLVALLRHYRERAGLLQSDVAERLARPQSFVSKYESGQRRLDLVELNAVCDALGVSVVTVVRRWADRA